MFNYKVTVEYDGTKYNGWQRQHTTENTIQGKIERVLQHFTAQQTVEIFASGRTDAGVHAKGQVFNFKTAEELHADELVQYCNAYLPQDIRVLRAIPVDERFHSRLLAVQKCYSYTLALQKPSVFRRKYVYQVPQKPSVEAMRLGAECLMGTHDFLAFSSLKKSKKSTVRTVSDIEITEQNGEIQMLFTGNGFLYHMVRILAGTLYDMGIGKRTACEVKRALQSGVREEAGTMLPPQGLCLEWVSYGEKCRKTD